MIILALDLGRSIGWAVADGGKHIASGTRTDKREVVGEQLCAWDSWLRMILDEHHVELVAYEQPLIPPGRFMPLSAIFPIHQEGVMLTLLTRRKLQARCAPPTSIKKAATGNGRAKKPDMTKAAVANWRIKANSPHHADALGVLSWALGVEA